MKLFHKLLLAPATLGLLAPMVANANEANFRDVTGYTQNQTEISLDSFKPLSNKNPLLAGGEGHSSSQGQNDFDVDTFSSTTTASFTVNIAAGSVDTESANDNYLGWNFDWELATSTSFTGNDSLDVVLNSGVSKLMDELDMTNTIAASTDQNVELDSISYTTTLGERSTFFFGSKNIGGSSLYTVSCAYGSQTDTFSDCGVSAANLEEEFGTAFGASFDFGNGFAAAVGYEGQGMTTKGILTDAGSDAYGGNVSYTGDSYGVSISWANIENHADDTNAISNGATQSTGVNAYYTPDLVNFPSISVGFETNHDDSVTTTNNDATSHYFVGLQWDDLGNGTLGAAFGSKQPYAENGDALTMYEIFYSYNYADGITVTPILYSKENTGSTQDETGVIVKTAFSF